MGSQSVTIIIMGSRLAWPGAYAESEILVLTIVEPIYRDYADPLNLNLHPSNCVFPGLCSKGVGVAVRLSTGTKHDSNHVSCLIEVFH